MIKVTPFIATLGTERYKELLQTPFNMEMLTTHFNELSEGDIQKWKNITPLPTTLNDFINDMHRLGVDLYWGDWIEREYEPKDFLAQNKIEDYYVDLLNSIDKGHELTTEREGNNNEKKS